MTPAEIAALRALAYAATPGPWSAEQTISSRFYVRDEDDGPLLDCRQGHAEQERNAAFIAAARTAVPALLDEVERLRGALRDVICAHDTAGTCTVEGHGQPCGCEDDAAIDHARRVLGEAGKEEGR